MICELCGLTVDTLPENAIQVAGKLIRFANGEYHLFRRPPKEKIKRPQRNPDREPPMGTNASEVPR